VCSGKIDLKVAQQDIAKDWIAAYKKYFHTDQPLSQGRRSGRTSRIDNTPPNTSAPSGDPNGQVWVNTKSGVIWKQGSHYYGKTKEGKYMSLADALKAGYHKAGERKNNGSQPQTHWGHQRSHDFCDIKRRWKTDSHLRRWLSHDGQNGGNSNSANTGGKIKSVRQAGTELNLDFENGTTLTIPTTEATSSVMVRDKNGTMEYAD
jgi:hypothetical protein